MQAKSLYLAFVPFIAAVPLDLPAQVIAAPSVAAQSVPIDPLALLLTTRPTVHAPPVATVPPPSQQIDPFAAWFAAHPPPPVIPLSEQTNDPIAVWFTAHPPVAQDFGPDPFTPWNTAHPAHTPVELTGVPAHVPAAM